MQLPEAKEKYYGQMVRHKTKPYLFFVANVYVFEGVIKCAFQHPHYSYIPEGMPLNATISEMTNEWDIIPIK